MTILTAMAIPLLDLKATAVWTIRIEDDLSNDDERRYASLRYNFQPKLSPPEDARVNLSKISGQSTLELNDRRSTFKYKGQHEAADEEAYVLVVSEDAKEKELVLRKLDARHVYNLTGDPSGMDVEELVRTYPQLSLADEDEEDMFGESDDDVDLPIEQDNPFDYRHYLSANTDVDELESKGPKDNSVAPSTVGTPKLSATRPLPATISTTKTSTTTTKSAPTSAPTTKTPAAKNTSIFNKRKATKPPAAAAKNSTKRVKAGGDDEPRATPTSHPTVESARPTSIKPTVPKVRLDRKASIRPPPDDDEGELILENETPTTAKPYSRNTAMSLALSGQLGSGPISLRSAANSPAGQMASASASPMRSRGNLGDGGLGINLEGSISPDELAARGSIRSGVQAGRQPSARLTSSRNDDHDHDDDDEGDVDIEEQEEEEESETENVPQGLESPVLTNAAITHGHAMAATAPSTGKDDDQTQSFHLGDDDDDLDEQLARAFENDDDIPGTLPANESEEESEEE